MEVVFLIGAIQTVFLISLVLTKKSRMLADIFLALSLLFLGIHLLSYYLHTLDSIDDYPILYVYSLSLPMLHGFLTYVYVDVITMKFPKIKWQYVLHLIPYVFFTILLSIITNNSGFGSDEIIIKLLEYHPFILIVFSLCNFFLGPIYMLLSIKVLRKHRKNIGKWFSKTENIDLNWLRYIIIINIIIWFIVVIVGAVASYSTDLIGEKMAQEIVLTAVTLSVFFIGYFGIKQQVIYSMSNGSVIPTAINENNKNSFDTPSLNEKVTHKYEKSGLNENRASEIYVNLKGVMKDSSFYKNEELTLVELSKRLEVHPNHLSQVINEREGKNFYNYINSLRINEFIKLAQLPENKKYTMISLAYDCGFSAKSTFNKHFKLNTGKTPTEFFNS